ncbi:MAG: DUF4430 domain-containing protein [Clostridia bacterium]|nr:DUF4430 domain-containing protein [Clostridia bacterium]
MRRKLLTIFICLLVAVSLVSCGRVNNPIDTHGKSAVNITEESADESLPTPVAKTEKTVALKKTEKAEEVKNEKSQGKNETIVNSITDESNSGGKAEEAEKGVFKCTLSVRCDTVFKNITELDKEKAEVLPKNGIIYPQTEVVFYEGESVFNVLTREFKKNRIHIDFVNTPMYNTIYIKGISNLYERDCGELSGWIYAVNGKIPSCGCSQYILSTGDKIEFVYTCDLGNDIDLK